MRRTPLAAILASLMFTIPACTSSNGGATVTILGYTVAIKTAPPATAQAGTSVPIAFTVTENESDGSSKAASAKSFTVVVTAGGGTVGGAASTTLTTGSDGSASTTWVLGATVGTQTLRGSVSATQYLDVNLTATSPPATQLALTTAPSTTAQNGVALALQPTVQLKDASGNPVAQALVPVTAAIGAGGGTLGGGTLTVSTNASGAAVFSGLTLSGLVGTRILTFTATLNGTAVSLSATVALTAGAATQLALTTAPAATAVLALVLTQQPTVQLRDASGNPVAQALVAVTGAIDVGGGTLGGGALTVNTNASGAAVFSGLAISGIAGSRTLKFTATLNGQNATITSPGINVVAATITSVELVPRNRVKVGQVYGFDVTQRLADGTTVQHPVTWSILVPGTATITGTGVLNPLLAGSIGVVSTIDGVAWTNVITGYDWIATGAGSDVGVSLASEVSVTNSTGTPEFPTLSFTCSGGVFGVSVGFSGIVTGNGAVTYTGAGAVTVSETWLQSGPSLKTLTYPGATNLIRKNFALAVATNWNTVFTFNFTFNETPLVPHATAWQLNGISAAIAPVITACPGNL